MDRIFSWKAKFFVENAPNSKKRRAGVFLPSTEDSHLGRGGGMPRTAKSTKSAICGAFGTAKVQFTANRAIPFGNRQIHPRFDDAGDT